MARALGRYELLRPLARGGMAEVYLARRRAAGVEKWLVVKRMRPERSGDPRFLDLFVREARLSMSLAHQNIVPVFDFGRIDDQVFLAMERVEGRDLGSSLARAPDHRLPPLLAAFVAAECCQALDYAHQRKGPDGVALGVVHRDVTPRNVLLSWSGEVKLTDFGIAALAGDATSRLLGTPQYMAPEQARSESIDPRADIYAIGLILREALTGIRPRPGADRDSMLDAARRGVLLPWSAPVAPPPDTDLALGSGDHSEPAPAVIPPALVAIVDRATASTAADRYPDARSMLEDLDAFIVAERASRKVESPARQLAAWLATVWDGERDDAGTDAAIVADHLVSFLDDGALELIGTGTMRSLAATAADEAEIKSATSPGPPRSGTNPPVAPATGRSTTPPIAPAAGRGTTPPIAPAPPARADTGPRPSRISSSHATVASGSFHTIPTSSAARTRRRRSLRLGGLSGLVLGAIASSAVVFWIASRTGDRNAASGPPSNGVAVLQAGPAAGSPGAGSAGGHGDPGTGTERPDTGHAVRPDPAQTPTADAGRHDTARPGIVHATTGSNPVAAGTAHPTGSSPTSAATSATPPGGAHNAPARPSTGSRVPPETTGSRTGSGSRQTVTASEPDAGNDTSRGAGSGGDGSGSGSVNRGGTSSPHAGTCRVRINLTPWAYYTADEDPTRHETPGTIELTPGPHRLHVWNPELHVERDIILNVPPDRETMNYSAPLQPSSLSTDAGPQ